MSGKEDFDDEGLPLLPKHTKVRLPRHPRARGASPRSTRGRALGSPMKVPDRPHVVWRAYAFRSRGFFRASRAGDAMRARAHPRVRGRAAMRARFPQRARIRRPTRASRARRPRPRAPRPPGSLAARTRRTKRDLPVGCHRAESASRDSASPRMVSFSFSPSFFLAVLRKKSD